MGKTSKAGEGWLDMLVSTRGRYALRMMVDLAEHQSDGFVSLKDIAKRQEISKKYLEQIVPVLNLFGLVQTARGYQGGYRLAKDPAECTVLEILQATEGTMAPVSCLESDTNTCPRQDDCLTLSVWSGLYKAVDEYLASVTLQDILDTKRESFSYTI